MCDCNYCETQWDVLANKYVHLHTTEAPLNVAIRLSKRVIEGCSLSTFVETRLSRYARVLRMPSLRRVSSKSAIITWRAFGQDSTQRTARGAAVDCGPNR